MITEDPKTVDYKTMATSGKKWGPSNAVAFELRDWMLAQKLIKEPDKTEPEKTYMLGSRRDEEEFVGVRVPIEGTIPKDVSSALQQVLEEKITIGTQLQRIAKKNPAIEGDWTAVPPDIDDPSTTMDERAQSV